jgi:hypothetical protein
VVSGEEAATCSTPGLGLVPLIPASTPLPPAAPGATADVLLLLLLLLLLLVVVMVLGDGDGAGLAALAVSGLFAPAAAPPPAAPSGLLAGEVEGFTVFSSPSGPKSSGALPTAGTSPAASPVALAPPATAAAAGRVLLVEGLAPGVTPAGEGLLLLLVVVVAVPAVGVSGSSSGA